MSAESGDGWGTDGLGYYLGARLLWNTKADPKALLDDFYQHAFGPAQGPVRRFYALIDGANKPRMSADLVGRMYRAIEEARKLTTDPGITGRLNDLTLYTRFVELSRLMHDAQSEGAAMGLAYRARRTHMAPSYSLWRDTRNWPVRPAGNTVWSVPEGQNPWKSSAPFTQQEIDTLLSEGIANNPLIPFKPVTYSQELVPATPLHLQTPGAEGGYGFARFDHHFYFWANAAGPVAFTGVGGFVGHSDTAQTSLEVRAMTQADARVLANYSVVNDQKPHEFTFTAPAPGLYRVDAKTKRMGLHVDWPAGTPVSFASSLAEPIDLSSRINMYFYVPTGTVTVGGYASGVGLVRDGSGKNVFEFDKTRFRSGDYFNIPVPAGQDGKLWEFAFSAGPRLLMTVPPYLAQSGSELLLPREVVEADRAH
jgi:hypothetical protein